MGLLRFQKPQDPHPGSPSPDGPISCIRVDGSATCTPGTGLGASPSSCAALSRQSEDCLFLDIYVPESAFQSDKKLPVVVWIYGGAFVMGSKNDFDLTKIPLYDGKGLINNANGNLIFVTGNYRLGAFGWMAGSYLEGQRNATTNAGLWDQRKILSFVNKHIGLVNGDNSQVSVWGESAGASSIMHHLIADFDDEHEGLLFSKAILQSPAFQWQWDQTGSLNKTYSTVADIAGCTTGDLSCLQEVTMAQLSSANQAYFQNVTRCDGLFPMGPSIDGTLIKELPAVSFSNGDKQSIHYIKVYC